MHVEYVLLLFIAAAEKKKKKNKLTVSDVPAQCTDDENSDTATEPQDNLVEEEEETKCQYSSVTYSTVNLLYWSLC